MLPETLTVEDFRQIVTLKAQGKTWGDMTPEIPLSVRELKQVPWELDDVWETHYAQAARWQKHETIAKCTTKLETALLASTTPHDMVDFARALSYFLKLPEPRTNAACGTRSAERTNPPHTEPLPTDEDEVTEELIELAEAATAPDDEPADEELTADEAAAKEEYEHRLFTAKLKQHLQQHPELLQQAMKHVPPTPPTPPTPPKEEEKAAPSLRASMGILLFVTLCALGFTSPARATNTLEERVVTTEQPTLRVRQHIPTDASEPLNISPRTTDILRFTRSPPNA